MQVKSHGRATNKSQNVPPRSMAILMPSSLMDPMAEAVRRNRFDLKVK